MIASRSWTAGASASSASTGESTRPPLRNPAKRAFVVQFEPAEGARRRLRGRVELVASGEVARFRSIKQLVAFLVGTLRRGAGAGSGLP